MAEKLPTAGRVWMAEKLPTAGARRFSGRRRKRAIPPLNRLLQHFSFRLLRWASVEGLRGCGALGREFHLFWNGGRGTNSRAEIVALCGLLQNAKWLAINSIKVASDPKVVINWLQEQNSLQVPSLQLSTSSLASALDGHIETLYSSFNDISFHACVSRAKFGRRCSIQERDPSCPAIMCFELRIDRILQESGSIGFSVRSFFSVLSLGFVWFICVVNVVLSDHSLCIFGHLRDCSSFLLSFTVPKQDPTALFGGLVNLYHITVKLWLCVNSCDVEICIPIPQGKTNGPFYRFLPFQTILSLFSAPHFPENPVPSQITISRFDLNIRRKILAMNCDSVSLCDSPLAADFFPVPLELTRSPLLTG